MNQGPSTENAQPKLTDGETRELKQGRQRRQWKRCLEIEFRVLSNFFASIWILVWNVSRFLPLTTGGAGERGVWIPSVIMWSGDVTYFGEYGRYFLIGYHVSEIESLLLLAERI